MSQSASSSSPSIGDQPATTIGSVRFELLDPTALDDPYPIYDQMRATAPMYRDRRFLGWILTRYDDVAAVLKDPRVSSKRPTADEPIGRSLASVADELRELRAFQSRWMLYLDPPDHSRLRSLVGSSFTATRVAAMRGRIEDLVEELLGPARETHGFDVVRDLARPLPAVVIAGLIGLPREDRENLAQPGSRGGRHARF
jgi:cytochrome P450